MPLVSCVVMPAAQQGPAGQRHREGRIGGPARRLLACSLALTRGPCWIARLELEDYAKVIFDEDRSGTRKGRLRSFLLSQPLTVDCGLPTIRKLNARVIENGHLSSSDMKIVTHAGTRTAHAR